MMKPLGAMVTAAVLLASTVAPTQAQTSNIGSAPDAAAPSAAGDDALPAGAGASVGGYLTEPSASQTSAADYIGEQIYNADNESIGEVKDLIIEKDGGPVAAVVGVGGFLGIGDKDVAVPMSKIDVKRNARNGDQLHLSTSETAQALQDAPQFKGSGTDAMTTSSTTGSDVPKQQ